MSVPEYKVVHSIPGRIRLRIQELRHDVIFATRLRALVGASAAVTETRVDPAAASIVVQYREKSLSGVQIQEQLAVAIEQAADSELLVRLDVKVPGYALQGLTAYEYLQVQDIVKWRQKPSSVFADLSGKALAPIQEVADALIPDRFLKKIIPLMESATENWHRDWEALKQQAKMDDLGQLKRIPLEQCDRLAESVKDRAANLASVEGGAGAFLGMAGEAIDADLFLRVSIETIHGTGLCYGYAPRTEWERQFAWAILAIATALTTQERLKAFSRLQDLQHVLYQQVIGDLIEESVKTKLKDLTTEAILKSVLPRILKLEGAEAFPGIGLVTGILGARATIEEVSTAARREFQLRWLLEKQHKRSVPEPSTLPH